MTEQHGDPTQWFTPFNILSAHADFQKRILAANTAENEEAINDGRSEVCTSLMEYLDKWTHIGKRSPFAEAGILYTVENFWEELTPLHDQYASFHDFAVQTTGEDYTTFRNKISIYKVFILNDAEDDRVANANPADFMDVPIGKLQKAVGAIRAGKMQDDQWDALLDDNIHDKQFHYLMQHGSVLSPAQDGSDGEQVPKPDITVDMQTGKLTYWPGMGAMAIVIGQIDVKSKGEGIRGAIDHLITIAHIKRRD